MIMHGQSTTEKIAKIRRALYLAFERARLLVYKLIAFSIYDCFPSIASSAREETDVLKIVQNYELRMVCGLK